MVALRCAGTMRTTHLHGTTKKTWKLSVNKQEAYELVLSDIEDELAKVKKRWT